MFKVFRITSDIPEDCALAGEVSDVNELTTLLNKPENNLQRFFILNKKGEEVDQQLKLIIKPTLSLTSMVGALQDKFSSKRRR